MRRLLPLFLVFFTFQLSAQQLPLYTQYVFNPYMLNPSMVAYSSRPELNLLYRQQWSNIDDGPKTLQIDGQYRLNNKMALGVFLNQDRTVLLSQTMAMVTYGYRVFLADDHTLGFGLSAGMFQNRLRSEDASPADSGDPALMSSVNNNIAVDGQFGVHYRTRGFVFAYSLVNLFDRKYVSSESFQKPKFGQLKNQIIFTSYRFDVIPGTLALQPNAAYRLSENNLNYFEGSLIASIKNIVDVGGGYRQDFGPTAMVRVNVGPLQAGFAYDFPSNTGLISPGGTKEIQVKWRFGKSDVEEPLVRKKRDKGVVADTSIPPSVQENNTEPKQEEKQPVTEEKKEEPVPQEVKQEPVVVQQTPPKEEPAKTEPVVVEQKKPDPVVSQPVVTEPAVNKPEAGAYYYIINTFEDRANAENFLKEVKAKGVKAEMVEVQTPHYYYIHLPEYKTTEISVDKVLELQKKTGYKDGWFKRLN